MNKGAFYLLTLLAAGLFFPVLFGPLSTLGRVLAFLAGWFLLTTLAWQARKIQRALWAWIGLAVLAGLFWPTASLVEFGGTYGGAFPQPVLNALTILILIWPALALAVAAVLLYAGLGLLTRAQQAGPRTPREATPVIVLSALLVVKTIDNLCNLLVWDNTNDPIEGYWLTLPVLAAVCSGAALAVGLPRRLKPASLAFLLLIPAAMILIGQRAMQVDFRSLTAERAARISRALEAYHRREGRYPPALRRLAPRERLSIPSPVIIYGQDWCYEGGAWGYRLGYVNRDHWSSPCFFGQVAAIVGDVSALPPICSVEAAALKNPLAER